MACARYERSNRRRLACTDSRILGHQSRLWPNTPKFEMYYRALRDPEAERARGAKREAAGWYVYGNEADHSETREQSTAPAA
jgi:hypothetical protein